MKNAMMMIPCAPLHYLSGSVVITARAELLAYNHKSKYYSYVTNKGQQAIREKKLRKYRK